MSSKLKYDLILFDVDDTLVDFKKSEEAALKKVFKAHNIIFNKEIKEYYIEVNHKLWEDFELGKYSRDYILTERFDRVFKKFDLDASSHQLNLDFQESLGYDAVMVEGAYEFCEQIIKKVNTALVTNGTFVAQDIKIKKFKLDRLFKHIFISEVLNCKKPDKEFFGKVFDELGSYDLSRVLIVGDSLTSDIQGGINYGIDTCWFNIRNVENISNIKPTYEISSLKEVFQVLSK